jgi:peroxiredoxin
MKTSVLILAVVGLSLFGSTLAPPVLRPSPDFSIRLADGSRLSLSSLHGEVVALMFVHTTCPLCQQASQTFNKLYDDYGARGFVPVYVVFDSRADVYVPDFVNNFDVVFPVGSSSLQAVVDYLNFPVGRRFTIPQIVWIDANGDIRSQTPMRGGGAMLTESYWRNMIETLLTDSPKAR